jgi:hypothetical protein
MNHRYLKNKNNRGQAMIIGIMFLLFSSMALIYGISSPLLSELRILANLKNSNQSYFAAEGAMEDAIIKLKKGRQLPASSQMQLNGATVITTVADISSGKQITSVGESMNRIRKLSTGLTLGSGISFHYGIQTGNGGFILDNNAGVYGNVYSNGEIVGSGGAFITGSAIAANSASATPEVSNLQPFGYTGYAFGMSNSNQDVAQSFIPATTGSINKLRLNLKKIGNPANLTVRIATNNNGVPSSTSLVSTTLSASLITNQFGFVEVALPQNPELQAGSTYWIILDGSSDSSKYYEWGTNNNYTNGQLIYGRYGGSMSPVSPSADGIFEIYYGGVLTRIEGVNIGSNGEGDAHANTVNNSSIVGNLFCKNGTGNNKSCNTSKNDPSPQPYAISEANIDSWKRLAEETEVFVGNRTISENTTLGPLKIDGNLHISGGKVLTLSGTIWVTGNITVGVNGSAVVSPTYEESGGILMADGYIELSNNVVFSGSGAEKSYLLLLTTSDCPVSAYCSGKPAISVQNNVSAVVLNAQKGTIYFNNNAGATAATAHRLHLSQNATITYLTGLADLSFSSGPSGGYEINFWREIE